MIDRNGKTVKIGDTIRFVDYDSADHGDIGVVTKIVGKTLYAHWNKTEMIQPVISPDSFELVNTPTIDSVEAAVDFLVSKGYTVNLTRS